MRTTTLSALGTVVVLAACDHVTAPGMCGCSPVIPPATLLDVKVLSPQDRPAPNAKVVIERLAGNVCDLAAAGQIYLIQPADSTGAFRWAVYEVHENRWCLRLSAEPANATDSRPSAQQLVSLRPTPSGAPFTYDTVRVTLQLRP
jgi:hypothetical protein